jgi:short-chain fatty acids transporter
VSFAEHFERWFRTLLPGPFTIAVLLTVFTFLISFLFGNFADGGIVSKTVMLMQYWENGLWEPGMLVFAVQMMLMLVLGHVLALSRGADRVINAVLHRVKSPAAAAVMVLVTTMVVAWFNWGLGLIFGALMARKCGEYARQQQIAINYPMIGAAGYAGLMVWHGGLSGSSLSKVAEAGHLAQLTGLATAPNRIDYAQTVFLNANILIFFAVLLLSAIVFYFLAKTAAPRPFEGEIPALEAAQKPRYAAERLDYSRLLSLFFAGVVLCVVGVAAYGAGLDGILSFFTPNHINLLLLGCALLAHRHFEAFVGALAQAIGGISGILIQFPLYFGIMGMLKGSGLIVLMSQAMGAWASDQTFAMITFFSSAFVNILVPSGGGQWAIQGPILVEAAMTQGLPLNKILLAFAYGDQLTNMLQPFWALPLLGITGLKAREILPWCLVLFACGLVVFVTGILLF